MLNILLEAEVPAGNLSPSEQFFLFFTMLTIFIVSIYLRSKGVKEDEVESVEVDRFSSEYRIMSDTLYANSYYMSLDGREKEIFKEHCELVVFNWKIIGKGLDVGPDKKALIGVSAAMLSNGFDYFPFRIDQRVIFYPGNFYSERMKNMVKGLWSSGGVLWLAWDASADGFLNLKDKKNVVLHELAHDLMFRIFKKPETFSEKADCMRALRDIFLEKRNSPFRGDYSSIRTYGWVNFPEFFAVITESYFECKEELAIQLPEVCEIMNNLYRPVDSRFSLRTILN